MEMSHRSKQVVDMVNETEELSRELLQIPKEFEVLFLQGGASLQFSMIPMNLLTKMLSLITPIQALGLTRP